MEKPLKRAWMGPRVKWGQGVRESAGQGEQYQLGWWRHSYGACLLAVLREGSALLSGRKWPLWSHPDVRQFNFSSYVPGAFGSVAPALEFRASESKLVHAWILRRMWVKPAALCLTQPEAPLVFIAKSYGDFCSGTGSLGWGSGVGPEPLAPQVGPPQLRKPSQFISTTRGCGPSPSVSLSLLPVLMWLLYILSCRTSIQLDFRWFWRMIVL